VAGLDATLSVHADRSGKERLEPVEYWSTEEVVRLVKEGDDSVAHAWALALERYLEGLVGLCFECRVFSKDSKFDPSDYLAVIWRVSRGRESLGAPRQSLDLSDIRIGTRPREIGLDHQDRVDDSMFVETVELMDHPNRMGAEGLLEVGVIESVIGLKRLDGINRAVGKLADIRPVLVEVSQAVANRELEAIVRRFPVRLYACPDQVVEGAAKVKDRVPYDGSDFQGREFADELSPADVIAGFKVGFFNELVRIDLQEAIDHRVKLLGMALCPV
jgi:hypothetical protein